MVRQYNKLATTLVKYEALYHGAWLKRIEHSRSALHSALIVHHPRTGAPGIPHVPSFSCPAQQPLHPTGTGAAGKCPVSMGAGGSVHLAHTYISCLSTPQNHHSKSPGGAKGKPLVHFDVVLGELGMTHSPCMYTYRPRWLPGQ